MIKKKLVFLTGAGISAESGISTFRSQNGLWYEYKVEDVAHINGWRKNRQLVLDFYNERRKGLKDVQPNAAHTALAELEKDFQVTIITQNVDDLHERAGSTDIIHLHGELTKMCSSNNKKLTLPCEEDIKIGDKHEDGSQLRPFIVWFGEDVPLMDVAENVTFNADIFVVIGTSLEVYPAAGLINYTNGTADLYYIDPNPATVPDDVTLIQEKATVGISKLTAILKEKYGQEI